MKFTRFTFIAFAATLLSISSCHKDEAYYCYLVDSSTNWDVDTIDYYNQGFIYVKSRPQTDCEEVRDSLSAQSGYSINYYCDCGWEPE